MLSEWGGVDIWLYRSVIYQTIGVFEKIITPVRVVRHRRCSTPGQTQQCEGDMLAEQGPGAKLSYGLP